MHKEVARQVRTAFILLILMTIITGFLYPLSVTALAQLFFPSQANGSLIIKDNIPIGSQYIGQSFTSPNYFWGRPSATAPYPYNGEASSGSNSAPSNPKFLAIVKERATILKKLNLQNDTLIPVELVTASASGLDPDISPAAALYQVIRIAEARGISSEEVQKLIANHIQPRSFGVLGEPRLNVLQLNLALDNLIRTSHGRPTSQP